MKVELFSRIIQGILWISTFVLVVLWLLKVELCFEHEPLTMVLGLVSTAVSFLSSQFKRRLKIEKFSTANALAQGYVNNFIEPTLTQLIKSSSGNEVKPVWYIYIPQLLSELTPQSIERLKVKLSDKGLANKTVKVKLDEGRGVRDVMNLSKADINNVYFDFPNTLLTLLGLIDYKVDSPRDSVCDKEKNELGKQYIEAFKSTLVELLAKKGLYQDYIKLTDKNLELGI